MLFDHARRGGSPRIRGQLNAGATSDTTRTWKTIHTIHAPIHSNRRLWKDNYNGEIILGDLVGLKLPGICLIGQEKSRKNLTLETCPDGGSNPGPLPDSRACHSGGQIHKLIKLNKKEIRRDECVTEVTFNENYQFTY